MKHIFLGILLFSLMAIALPVAAMTEAERQALIVQVESQIYSLIQQIQQMQSGQAGSSQAWCHTFNQNLGFANSGSEEVGYLHTALTMQGISFAPDTGNTYSDGTAKAVTGFQDKYASEILRPYGLSSGTGYTGASTRAKLNTLYGCNNSQAATNNTQINTSACTPSWSCTSWGACASGRQTRTCTDLNYCGTSANKPAESQSCTSACTPNWSCTSWGACSSGRQTRTCTDLSYCGTSANKPAESQACASVCTPSWSCNSWGACSNGQQTRICTDLNYCGTSANKPAESQSCTSACTPNWQCGEWGQCIETSQTRICEDLNECKVASGMPSTSQFCPNTRCGDSDALGENNPIDFFHAGTVTAFKANGSYNTYREFCAGSNVFEYYCDPSLKAGYSSTTFKCPNGCYGGQCLQYPLGTPTPSCRPVWSCTEWSECEGSVEGYGGLQSRVCEDIAECGNSKNMPDTMKVCGTRTDDSMNRMSYSSCIDSDNDKDYFTKATVQFTDNSNLSYSNTDACFYDILTEWYCEERDGIYNLRYKHYTCPKGCTNGACLK